MTLLAAEEDVAAYTHFRCTGDGLIMLTVVPIASTELIHAPSWHGWLVIRVWVLAHAVKAVQTICLQ